MKPFPDGFVRTRTSQNLAPSGIFSLVPSRWFDHRPAGMFSIPGSSAPIILAVLAAMPLAHGEPGEREAAAWQPLYHGTLDDFRIYFRGQGFIDDVHQQRVFLAEPEGIHVIEGTNGLIVTKVPYRHYHVKVDYRWGTTVGSKNAGLMTHVDLASKVVKDNRPRSIEINMREDTPGSIWLASGLGPFASTFVEEGTETYLPQEQGGVAHDPTPFGKRIVYARYPDGKINTRPWGEWNTMEAIVRGSESVEIILNGKVVNRVFNIRDISEVTRKPGAPLAEGGIGLQSEGQEIFYRNFMIRKLDPQGPAARADRRE